MVMNPKSAGSRDKEVTEMIAQTARSARLMHCWKNTT